MAEERRCWDITILHPSEGQAAGATLFVTMHYATEQEATTLMDVICAQLGRELRAAAPAVQKEFEGRSMALCPVPEGCKRIHVGAAIEPLRN